jgi:sacsin
MESTGLGTGEAFFQSEPLTIRLKNLIRDYPEGVGIIKELVQNADDAGAHRVVITFDWRNHSFENLPDPRMEVLMGPAMLVYNNSQFTDQDFKNIQSLGDSGKRQTLWKTGRFGVGFNSVYHVTDYPSFISRDRLIFFDPHASAIPGATLGEPGKSWKFAETGWWNFPDFMKIYEPGGLKKNTQDFEGTLFRLPLRGTEQAKRSKIRNEPFTQENVDQLLAEFAKTGEEMLIFLKSVLHVQVREISADGTVHELLTITTQNEQVVKAEREKFVSPLADGTESLFSICQNRPEDLPSISYRHDIQLTTHAGQTTSTWRVTSLMRVEQELLNLMQQLASQGEKAVPWAGAAALISRTGDLNRKPFTGRAYCFLPLPQETNLPVHLNGFFDLDSSRRELTSDSNLTGRDTKRVLWNRLLVKHVVAHAYANLIVSLVEDIGKGDLNQYYSFFPTQQPIKALEELPSSVFRLLRKQRVLRSAIARPSGVIQEGDKRRIRYNHWVYPSTIKILPREWSHLLEPLRLEGIDLPEPALPKDLIEAFARSGVPLLEFKPSKLRAQLQTLEPIGVPLEEAPKACLRKKEWVMSLLCYCLSDGHRDLTGLPLAILEDGTLQSFGYNPPGFIYWVDSDGREILVNQIFGSHPEWFLEADCAEQIGLLDYCTGITYCSPEEVADRLYDLINPGECNVIGWEPNGEQIPNISWLTSVYSYLATVQNLPNKKLNQILLVPCDNGHLYVGGSTITPLWHGSKLSSDTIETLRYFDV